MFFIYDNIAATLVAFSVMLVLLVMQQRMRDASIERVGVYAAKTQSIEFGDWLQQDLANIGLGVSAGTPVTGLTDHATIPGMTQSFSYLKKIAVSDPSPSTITYQLNPVFEPDGVTPKIIDIDTLAVPLFEVRRLVNGVEEGKSPPYLTYFRVELLDDTGVDVGGVLPLADQVRVTFSMGVPLVERTYLRETHWGTTVAID